MRSSLLALLPLATLLTLALGSAANVGAPAPAGLASISGGH